MYKQSIIFFGIVLPVLGILALLGLGTLVKNKMTESFRNKETHYRTFKQNQTAAQEIEKKVSRQRLHIERWNKLLSEETASAVTTNLRTLSEKLPNKEFQQTAFNRSGGNGGFGAVSAQRSSQVSIAFRGTYRTMQKAFLELETRMPQLQLQELRIDPSTGGTTPLLNFQVTYTAWENGQ